MVCYILKLFFWVSAALPVYLLLRRPWRKVPARKFPAENMDGAPEYAGRKLVLTREFALGCFVLFHIGLLALALEGEYGDPAGMLRDAGDRLMAGKKINLMPFRTIGNFFMHFRFDAFMVNIVGNIVMFMPWGFGLPLLWRRRQNVVSVGTCCLALPLFIETSQLFIGRNVDADDLILNFLGGCLGGGIYFLVRIKIPRIGLLAG